MPNLGDDPEEEKLLRIVGQRIRAARVRAGLSHTDLHVRSGVKKAYLFELERGVTNVTVKTLHRLANGLGIGVVEFFPASGNLRVDQLTVDSLLGLAAAVLKSLEDRKFAVDQAYRREIEAMRQLQGLLETMNKEAPRISEADEPGEDER